MRSSETGIIVLNLLNNLHKDSLTPRNCKPMSHPVFNKLNAATKLHGGTFTAAVGN